MLAPTPAPRPSRFTALRFAWRELRGGLRGFAVFIACIALGVLAIAGVGSVAASLADGIANAGQMISRRRPRVFAHSARGERCRARFLTRTARSRSPPRCAPWRARQTDSSTLVEVKAVDGAYPLFGTVVTDPRLPLPALFAQNDGAFGAAADPALLARLDLKTGDRITIGSATIELRAALTTEPDKLSGGIGLGRAC